MAKAGTIEARYIENDKNIGKVMDLLEDFRMIAEYTAKDAYGKESVRRFLRPDDGRQVLLFVRWKGKDLKIEHWEIFTEVSNSVITAEYLEAFEESIREL